MSPFMMAVLAVYPELQFIASKGVKLDRHLCKVICKWLETNPIIESLRTKQPENIDRLRASIQATGGAVYEPVCAFLNQKLIVVDGHQRVKTVGPDEWVEVVIFEWQTVEEIMKVGPDLNFIRYTPGLEDILGLIDTGLYKNPRDLADKTGEKEKKVRQLYTISGCQVIRNAVLEKSNEYEGTRVQGCFCSLTPAAKLVEACEGNSNLLVSLQNTFQLYIDRALVNAGKIAKMLNRDKSKNWPSSVKKKQYLDYYSPDWPTWIDVIKAKAIKDVDGHSYLELEDSVPSTKTGIHVSDSEEEWLTRFAVDGLGEWKNADIADLREFLRQLPAIGKRLPQPAQGTRCKTRSNPC